MGVVVTDLPAKVPSLDACAACVAGKSVHLPHKEGRGRASGYLERVHIDITGPMPVMSAGRKEYVYVVVDDHTRAVYTRVIRHRSDAVDAFRVFKAAAEGESGKKIREVMTGDAPELCMGGMRDICEREGIQLHTTVPYHPASNGVAERAIGVLTNAVLAMLHDAGLPKSLWAEAFSTATYVRNRTPTRTLSGRTPCEVLYGARPDLGDLRTFGAPCAIVGPSVRSREPDDRARMCVFVGYKYGGSGYRVWDPRRSVIVESMDVVFFEDGLPPPTYRESAAQTEGGLVQPSIGRPATPVPRVATQSPVLPSVPLPVPATTAAPPGSPRAVREPRFLTIKHPGQYMDAARPRPDALEGGGDASVGGVDSDSWRGGVLVCGPPTDLCASGRVSHAPSFP